MSAKETRTSIVEPHVVFIVHLLVVVIVLALVDLVAEAGQPLSW